MSERELLLKQMEMELPITLKVIRAIPQDKADYTPHERSQTAKKIVETMISEVDGIANILRGEEQVFQPVEVASLEEAVSAYETSFNACHEYLAGLSDNASEEPTVGMFASFFPRRIDGAWMFFKDSIHHRGQLSVYIRLAGGKVPSMYGPSADDNPFQQ